MNTDGRDHCLDVSGTSVEVVRKDIKNLHLGVYPPNGRVRVAAPLSVDDDAVRLAVVSRLGWIRRRQAEFAQQERQSRREFVTGESHYFEGRRYRLDVIEDDGPPTVSLINNSRMALRIRPDADQGQREKALYRWYRCQLRDRVPALLSKWEPEIGVKVEKVGIKRMKTRWGSCNSAKHQIWLNLELAKKPASCLEYIMVHEMVHLIESRHNERFLDLMDRFMPQWRMHRDELNQSPLGHADWRY